MLAAVIEIGGKGGIEEENGFADGHAVFCAAEAENVDAAFPGEFGWGAIEAGAGVGEACSIHVQGEVVRLAGCGDGLDFIDSVDAAGFSGLGDGDDAGFGEVDVGAAGG